MNRFQKTLIKLSIALHVFAKPAAGRHLLYVLAIFLIIHSLMHHYVVFLIR